MVKAFMLGIFRKKISFEKKKNIRKNFKNKNVASEKCTRDRIAKLYYTRHTQYYLHVNKDNSS